jgi:hypothetical protein
VPPLIDWALIDAAFRGSSGRDCPDQDAACWVFIRVRFAQFIYGSYPVAERWRVELVFLFAAIGVAGLLLPRVPYRSGSRRPSSGWCRSWAARCCTVAGPGFAWCRPASGAG